MTKRRCAELFSCLLITAGGVRAHGAACCGGGFAAPSLITGDDRAQATLSFSEAAVHADVGADQIWRRRADGLRLQELRLDGAALLSDRWQLGGTLPLVRRHNVDRAAAGLGDLSANLGYEYLTDWTYHRYRPKGLGFIKLTAPTGQIDLAAGDPVRARGRGFWTLGIGSLVFKTLAAVDVFLNFGVHHAFARGPYRPGFGGDVTLGGGYSHGAWRGGGALATLYERGLGKPERVTTASVSLNYLWSEAWATTLTLSDQTLFGSPTNTSLSRSVMVWAQRRWPR